MKKLKWALDKMVRLHSEVAAENEPCNMEPELIKGVNMRRKLIFALLGGLLMQTIVPLDAIGAADKSSDDDLTEEMILEFLNNLFKVIKHDDLSDLGFIEQTLGVKAVLIQELERPNMERVKFYRMKVLQSKWIQKIQGGPHTYDVTQQINGKKMEVSLRFVFSPGVHQLGIAVEDMEKVFGKPQFFQFVEALSSPLQIFMHKHFAYRWRDQNDTVAAFTFNESGFLIDVEVFQNDDGRLKYYPL